MGKTGLCRSIVGMRDQQLCERAIIRVTSEAIIMHADKRMTIITASPYRPRK